MRWLIVEDALRDRKGHWFEYVRTFDQGLKEIGDQVVILADRQAEPFIQEALHAKPILPDSIWNRMGDGAGSIRRYLRVPVHAWQTWRAVVRFLKQDPDWDVIFVPTVLVHHLLGWYGLLFSLRKSRTRLLLFFPNLPIHLEPDGTPAWNRAPTTRLMWGLLNRMKPDILAGRVLLGVETVEMQKAFATLLGLPVSYFPHPVQPLPQNEKETLVSPEILMACYGPGRPEKGSDVLQKAITRYMSSTSKRVVRFAFQWIDDFKNEAGEVVRVDPNLETERVAVIRHYFKEEEYAKHLRQTQVMILPYRLSSYALRVSRVVIEAMVNGIPVVATQGTTLASQAIDFGAVISCEDGSTESLCRAIETAEQTYPELRIRALEQAVKARDHFSVRNFRDLLLANPN
jgi:glycosyltransferase involved in cell wall biosynthesis